MSGEYFSGGVSCSVAAAYAAETQMKMPMAVATGATRPLPPLRHAMVESPIIALPPMPPRKPERMLPEGEERAGEVSEVRELVR